MEICVVSEPQWADEELQFLLHPGLLQARSVDAGACITYVATRYLLTSSICVTRSIKHHIISPCWNLRFDWGGIQTVQNGNHRSCYWQHHATDQSQLPPLLPHHWCYAATFMPSTACLMTKASSVAQLYGHVLTVPNQGPHNEGTQLWSEIQNLGSDFVEYTSHSNGHSWNMF